VQRLPAGIGADPMTSSGQSGGRSDRFIDLRSDTYNLPTQAMMDRLGSAVQFARDGGADPRGGGDHHGRDRALSDEREPGSVLRVSPSGAGPHRVLTACVHAERACFTAVEVFPHDDIRSGHRYRSASVDLRLRSRGPGTHARWGRSRYGRGVEAPTLRSASDASRHPGNTESE